MDDPATADAPTPPSIPAPTLRERYGTWLVLVGVLAVSRVGYWFAGMRFDVRFADSAMQLLDRDILAANPFTAAWYLHIQPPLFNLAVGIVLRVFGDSAGVAFQVLYLGLTVAFAINLLELLCGFGMSRRWATALVALVVLSPSIVQFENLLFYTHVEMALLVVAARALQRWALDRSNTRALVGFSACLTVLALSRALYHPIWFVALGVALLIASRPLRRWALVLATLVPLLAGLSVGLKNYAMFGWFTTSSIEGSNWHRMTSRLTPEEGNELLDAGDITPMALDWRLCPDARTQFPDQGPSAEHPALDRWRRRPANDILNINHRSMVPCERQLRDEAFTIIREKPEAYMDAVSIAFEMVWYAPTPDLRVRKGNQDALAGPARVEAVLMGSPGEKLSDVDADTYTWQPGHVEWVILLAAPLTLVGLVVFMFRRRGRNGDPQALVAAFMACVLASSTILAQFLEVGENSRFRFTADPLLLAGMVFLITASRRRRAAPEPTDEVEQPNPADQELEPVDA
jgi:hypothetical protein